MHNVVFEISILANSSQLVAFEKLQSPSCNCSLTIIIASISNFKKVISDAAFTISMSIIGNSDDFF